METKSMCMVVPQVLLNDTDYLDWSVRIRTYLKARDLWEIVAVEPPNQQEDDEAAFKGWNTKNFMALHVIQNGCGPEPFQVIRNINSAKTAWDVLAEIYNIPPPPLETKSVVLENLRGEENYLDWSAQVRKYMIAKDVWHTIVNEPPKKEVDDDDDAFKAWRKEDLLALHVIQSACGQEAFSVIRDKNSAKDAWRALAQEFRARPKPKFTNINIGVRQLLDKNNYDEWSVWVRTYLELQDLWNVGEDEPDNSEAALNVIKKTCGPTMKSVIKECRSAKDAWEKLSFSHYRGSEEWIYSFFMLLEAVMKHDWSAMMDCIKENPREFLTQMISVDGDTALHWAVLHHETNIVKQLVDLMLEEELEAQNNKGMTALAQVAACGNIEMAKCILKKNSNLIGIADGKNRIPVVRAFEYGVTEVALYLYENTPLEVLKRDDTYIPTVVVSCISANAFDIALDLIRRSPSFDWQVSQDIYGNYPLSALASQPSISSSRSRLLFWERWIYTCIPEQLVHSSTYKRKKITEPIDETWIYIDGQNQQQSHEVDVYESVLRLLHWILPNLLKLLGMKHIYELRVRHVQALEFQSLLCKVVTNTEFQAFHKELFEEIFLKAVKVGNHELIENILREDPRLLLRTDSKSRSLFAYAVLYRQPRIFSLIYGLEAKEEIINMPDQSGNTLLHMTGMLELATNQIERIPGAGMEMRSELQWFKEIERMSSPFTREMKNDSGETAKEIFTKNHKNMKNDGEKWMKETASSSSVVGTLIITITFAAAITVPGGNNGEGFPMFSDKKLFQLFILSNALSFVSSIAAVLTFLVILTTSYAEEDFFISLPRKLMIGLSTLSFSISTMMIAFCAALFIMLPGQSWMVILIICLASIFIIWFLLEKYPNLVEMTKSAYGPHMFDKKLKSGLYQGMPLRPDSLPTNVEASSTNVPNLP